MPDESMSSGDSARLILPHQHTINALAGKVHSFKRPADMFGHQVEDLLDLAHTKHHGGDPVVSRESLEAALTLAGNAVRLRVWDADKRLKHLTFGANARTNAGGYVFME